MTTADCKKLLKQEFNESGWKRERKYKDKDKNIIRVFSNAQRVVKLTTGIDDSEVNDISGLDEGEMGIILKVNKIKKVPKDRFMFAIGNTSSAPPSYFYVYIGTKKVWDEHQRLDDNYEDEDWDVLYPVIKELQLGEDMESTFSPYDKISKEAMKKKLIARNFIFDQDYQDYMLDGSESNEEMAENIKQELDSSSKNKEYEKKRLAARSNEEKYVDDNIKAALEYIPHVEEVASINLIFKYIQTYKGNLLVSPIILFNGQKYIPRYSYLMSYLKSVRDYNLVKELLDLKESE